MDLSAVTHCKIHPAIGVARVGNSPEGCYTGPEVPGRAAPTPPGGTSPYKDDEGRLLRMACRFRVYGYDAAGDVVGEITTSDAAIAWTVHVANRKAAWYQFKIAMDIPEAAPPFVVGLRNQNVTDRAALVNDPGAKTISGADAAPVAVSGGSVFGKSVALGELRTDVAGRLEFLGGHGVSASVDGKPATTFANNDGWYDDTSDGPVDAEVTIGGRQLPVTGAWVVTAPADYGPGTYDITTMWDIVRDVAAGLDPSLRPPTPSFSRDIYPIFSRFSTNQWVNGGFAAEFGWDQPLDFSSQSLRATLADSSDTAQSLRGTIFSQFRDPSYAMMQPGAWPPMYGDSMALAPSDPRQWQALTGLQYEMLEQWADGAFHLDDPPWPDTFDQIEVAEQPLALDQAALEACLGGPFHPGCEITWPMRQKILYGEPLRIKRRVGPEPDIGPNLDQRAALSVGGPLDGSGPGDLSRWMAVPWQTDTSSCLYAYVGWDIGLFLPTFWPARVPNNIITEDQYAVIIDEHADPLARVEAFDPANRAYWLRRFGDRSNYQETINRFVEDFGDAGVVAPRPGPGGDFPEVIHVETGNAVDAPLTEETVAPGPLPNPRDFR